MVLALDIIHMNRSSLGSSTFKGIKGAQDKNVWESLIKGTMFLQLKLPDNERDYVPRYWVSGTRCVQTKWLKHQVWGRETNVQHLLSRGLGQLPLWLPHGPWQAKDFLIFPLDTSNSFPSCSKRKPNSWLWPARPCVPWPHLPLLTPSWLHCHHPGLFPVPDMSNPFPPQGFAHNVPSARNTLLFTLPHSHSFFSFSLMVTSSREPSLTIPKKSGFL